LELVQSCRTTARQLDAIISRLTALGLTTLPVYALLVLGKLAQGEQAYHEFMALAETR
jgi:hypothetical protein